MYRCCVLQVPAAVAGGSEDPGARAAVERGRTSPRHPHEPLVPLPQPRLHRL